MTAYTKPEQVQMRQNPSMDMGKWARMSTPSVKTNENLTAATGEREPVFLKSVICGRLTLLQHRLQPKSI